MRRFLRGVRLARLATVGPDGYPHVVPLWYMLEGDDIVMGTERGDRKTRNLLANPKAAVVIGGDPSDKAGYMFQGDVTIEPSDRRTIRRLVSRYETDEDSIRQHVAEYSGEDNVLLRLKPRSVTPVWW